MWKLDSFVTVLFFSPNFPVFSNLCNLKANWEMSSVKRGNFTQNRKGFLLPSKCYLQDAQLVPFVLRKNDINCPVKARKMKLLLDSLVCNLSFHIYINIPFDYEVFQHSSDELVFNFLKLKYNSCCEIENGSSFITKRNKDLHHTDIMKIYSE